MNEYEILLMLDPESPEERQNEIIARTRELVEKGGGTWLSHDPWGRRRLAYEIDHKTDGVYHLLQFDAAPATLDEVSRVLKITDGVMRHMATRRVKGGGRTAPPRRCPRREPERERERPAPKQPQRHRPRPNPPQTRSRAEEYAEPTEPASEEAGADGAARRKEPSHGANINRVVLVGNLTKDPELRHTPGGTPVCKLRIAVNTRRKDETGQWVDKPNYFDVTVWGNQAESCSQYLVEGPPGRDRRPARLARMGGDRRLRKRQAVEVVAESVQFLGSRGDAAGGETPQFVPAGAAGESADFPASAADDDIPF